MSRVYTTSDLHLDHKNILKFRPGIASTVAEYNEIILDNIKSTVNKRDTLIIQGDVAFSVESLMRLKEIKCLIKILYLGNHDIQGPVKIEHLSVVFDKIFSLNTRNNVWLSHAPIHPEELRSRKGCVHGHTHNHIIQDYRYVNVCLERTNLKPVLFNDVIDRLDEQNSQKSVILDLFNR